MNRTNEANLLLRFGSEDCNSEEGVEVNFHHMQKVIVSNYGEKANFLTAPIKWEAKADSYLESHFWILFHDGTCILIIRLSYHQCRSFESRKRKRIITGKSVDIFRVQKTSKIVAFLFQ